MQCDNNIVLSLRDLYKEIFL